MPKKLAILFAYFLIYVVWGSTYYFIGVALHGFPTFLLSVLRFSTAGLILLVICACRGERVFTPRLVGRSAVSGIILLFIDMAVVMLAQRYVSSSLVAVVASFTAIWIMALDASDVEIYLSEQMYPCRYFDGICRSRVIVCRATGNDGNRTRS